MAEKGLSVRLQAVADLVTPGNVVVDVGTDHGYLPIYLVEKGICPGAIAMDVRPGPLSKARANIRLHRLEDKIRTRLSDGLDALEPGEGESLVLSGMGGPLMQEILSRSPALLNGFHELILQPQSDIPGFRHFLKEAGYEIAAEDMVFEDGKYYPMMRAIKKDKITESAEISEELGEEYGEILLKEKNPVLHQWLLHQETLLKRIQVQLQEASTEKSLQRLEAVQREQRLLYEALQLYDSDGKRP